jgi:nitrogen-specific signal transduction histidine kinase
MMTSRGDMDYHAILNAIPLMIFVVDDDVRIRDLNQAAAAVFGQDKSTILKRRGGEILHCLHQHDVPEGCGRGPFCRECLIRRSVTQCLQGQTVMRRRIKVEILQHGEKQELELLITTSPLPNREPPLALLIIEDINEISALRNIIPICSKCKKIRDDQEYWHSVESYFREYIGVDFSHGICPACMQELYPDYVNRKRDQEA